MKSLAIPFCLSLIVHTSSASYSGVGIPAQQDAFCSSNGRQNSNYCAEPSLQGTYIIRCRNGKAYFSDCSADLFCTNRVLDRGAFTNCYEPSSPNPNGDGRAQCAVGNDFDKPFNVTVYADDGSVYKVGPNEVSTPSPDYAGQGFFNDTYYPLGGGDGSDVGPADLDGFCETSPAPNVKGHGDGSSTTETYVPVSSSTSAYATGSGSLPSVYPIGPYPTGTGAGYAYPTGTGTWYGYPTGTGYGYGYGYPSGTGTGYGYPTGRYAPSGTVYLAPRSAPTAFTGDASSKSISMGTLVLVGALIFMVTF